MNLSWIVIFLIAAPLVLLFSYSYMERRLLGRPALTVVWKRIVVSSWGVAGWLYLTIFSSAILHNWFPNQSTHLMSGSNITLIPAIIWGSLIAWVCFGRSEDSKELDIIAAADQRLVSIFGIILSILKYSGCAVAVLAGGILAYVVFDIIGKRVEEMSTNEAIIAGSIIIGSFVYYGLSKRR